MSRNIYISYIDKILAFLAFITFIIYVSLISTDRYINKNSSRWASTSIDDKKYIGYTNMIGNIFMIFICGFDSVVFTNTNKINMNFYILKLITLIIFISYSYDVVLDNSPYSKFISALQPIVVYLQILSIGTIVQIISRLDLKVQQLRNSDAVSSIGSLLEDEE